jgi:beta-galactosidase
MLSKHSKLKTILKDPKGKEILEKYFGDHLKNPKLKMAMGFTLEKIGAMAGDMMPEGTMDLIDKELKALSNEEKLNVEPGKSIVEFNDNWLFTKEEEAEQVTLPHTWNLEDGNTGGANYYRGECSYVKEFMFGDEYTGKHIYIEVLAANSESKVYVNDKLVTRHLGCYSIYRANITDFVTIGEQAEIKIVVDNSHIEEVYPLMADFTFFGGLYRGVNLITVDDVHIDLEDHGSEGLYISQKSVTDELAVVEVVTNVSNKSEITETVTVKYELYDAEGTLVDTQEMTSSVMVQAPFVRTFNVENPTLWHSVDNPYLYVLKTSVIVDDVVVDSKENNIGLRYYHMDPQKGFFLNGQPYRLNGVSRHQDRDSKGWALSMEDHISDCDIIKEIGANSIRLAHYQHDAKFYDLCDKYGFVLWAEIPMISRNSKTDLTGENAKSQMIELIRQNYNYSSIVMWGVQNEITIGGQKNNLFNIIQELNDLTKKEDPYRLTTQAQVGHHKDEDPMNAITDVLAYNKYYGWYYDTCEDFDVWLNEFNKTNPNLSLGISEYGVEGILDYHTNEPVVKDYTEEYHALYHEIVLQIFNRHQEIWGTYVWNMFDFASDLRDEGGVKGMNNKGLVTYDRKTRKDAFYYYKATWSKEPVLHINSKRFFERIDEEITVKVYSNREDVTLYVNGTEVATQSPSEHIVLFEGVKLSKGENEIKVTCGDLEDTAAFKHVEELSVDYTCPEDGGSNVDNWFEENDLDLDTTLTGVEYPEGYYTVKDTIGDLAENPETLDILRKYMPDMVDSAMFEMAQAFSLELIKDFAKDKMPIIVYYNISKDINQVKK